MIYSGLGFALAKGDCRLDQLVKFSNALIESNIQCVELHFAWSQWDSQFPVATVHHIHVLALNGKREKNIRNGMLFPFLQLVCFRDLEKRNERKKVSYTSWQTESESGRAWGYITYPVKEQRKPGRLTNWRRIIWWWMGTPATLTQSFCLHVCVYVLLLFFELFVAYTYSTAIQRL